MRGEESSDEDEYVFYGTSLINEGDSRVGARSQAIKDPARVRALPVHQQEAVDEQGRRRFHGAFTGGFSAGYFNTVGSKVGFQGMQLQHRRRGGQQLMQQADC